MSGIKFTAEQSRTLKRLRRQKELSQEDVGIHLGISQRDYSRIENGSVTVSETVLKRLAYLFWMSIEELKGWLECSDLK